MTKGRWTLRELQERPARFERFETSQFERDYQRWMQEQEEGDALRDAAQEREQEGNAS